MTDFKPYDQIMTVKEAAKFLNISPDNLRYLSHIGKIPCLNVGLGRKKFFRYSRRKLEEWARGN
jgi:excisionase family DNA binding protein